MRYLLCYFSDALLHFGLLQQNHILYASLDNLFIQLPDGADIHLPGPCCCFHQRIVQFFGRVKRRCFFRVLIWKKQHKPCLIRQKIKIFQISGRRHHISVKIILIPVYVIQIDMRASAEPEQLCLIVHSIPGKFGDGCIRMQRIFLNLDICLTQAPHFRPDFF